MCPPSLPLRFDRNTASDRIRRADCNEDVHNRRSFSGNYSLAGCSTEGVANGYTLSLRTQARMQTVQRRVKAGPSKSRRARKGIGMANVPAYDPIDPRYWDEKDLRSEVERIFGLCSDCRLCNKFCGSFPKLFEAVDNYCTDEKYAEVDIKKFKAED